MHPTFIFGLGEVRLSGHQSSELSNGYDEKFGLGTGQKDLSRWH